MAFMGTLVRQGKGKVCLVTVTFFMQVRPNKIIPLFPEKRVTKKKPTREAGKTFFCILIQKKISI